MRGDIYELRANSHAKGHEQSGKRFAVVVQSDMLTMSTVLAAPTSTGARETFYRPEIEFDGQQTKVLVEQLQAADPERRFGRHIGRISGAEQEQIDRALNLLLGLY